MKRRKVSRMRIGARYRQIVQSVNSIIMGLDAKGRITFLNEFGQKLFGYSEGEVLGKNLIGTLAPGTESSGRDLKALIKDILNRPESYVYNENENIKRNGEKVWVSWTNKAIRDSRGRVTGVLSVGNDITERKRIQEALEKSEEEFRLAFESSRDAIFWAEPETGIILRCNRAAETLLERDRGEIVGQRHTILHPPDKKDFYVRFFREHVKSRNIEEDEAEIFTKSGIKKQVVVSASVTEVGGKKIIQGIFRDVTERKRREEQLLQAQKMEAMGMLTGGLAHDFNNILAGIMGYVSLLKMSPGVSHFLSDLDALEKLAQRGASLTGKLLAFSRRGRYQPKPVNIHQTIDDVLEVLISTSAKGIEIVREFAPRIPHIIGDESELYQVIMNLCLNACDAMSPGGCLTIKTAVRQMDKGLLKDHPKCREGEYVSVTVSDTGIGMNGDELEHIYKPFYTTKARRAGTGLGLSVVKSIVDKQGGFITLDSAPGKGTTFVVYMPAGEAVLEAEEEEKLPEHAGTETILLVDDEDDFRKSAARWLGKSGYEVIEASSGEEGVKIIRDGKVEVDIVVLDIVMKGMGGKQALERIRKISPRIPVIVCTGFVHDKLMLESLEKSADGLLNKPFTLDQLGLAIRSALDRIR